MKQLVFLRHGETVSNNTSCFNNKEEPLNAKGEQQAKSAAENLSTTDFDLVLCSPLTRTRQTLTPVLEGRELSVEYWEELQEIDWGNMQGQPYLPHQEAFSGIKQCLYAEGLDDLEKRAQQFWEKLSKVEAEQILIVSHGAIMCILFAVREKVEMKDWEYYRFNTWKVMGNCDVKKLEF